MVQRWLVNLSNLLDLRFFSRNRHQILSPAEYKKPMLSINFKTNLEFKPLSQLLGTPKLESFSLSTPRRILSVLC